MRKQIMEILTEICPGIDFENEKALIDDGLIDSLDIVAVVTELMEAFDVELGVDDLTPELQQRRGHRRAHREQAELRCRLPRSPSSGLWQRA